MLANMSGKSQGKRGRPGGANKCYILAPHEQGIWCWQCLQTPRIKCQQGALKKLQRRLKAAQLERLEGGIGSTSPTSSPVRKKQDSGPSPRPSPSPRPNPSPRGTARKRTLSPSKQVCGAAARKSAGMATMQDIWEDKYPATDVAGRESVVRASLNREPEQRASHHSQMN